MEHDLESMSDRETELRELAATLGERPPIVDAWVAKSFTDQLLVIDLQPGAALPSAVRDLLAAHDLSGINEVYDIDETDRSLVGAATDVNRHQFVDIQTRGEHQSYVID